MKLVLQNLRVEDKTVRYDVLKPFDTILNYNDNQLGLASESIGRIVSVRSTLPHEVNLEISEARVGSINSC